MTRSSLSSFLKGGNAPTPPDSNKPSTNNHDHDPDDKTHLKSKLASAAASSGGGGGLGPGPAGSKFDPTGNLPHDQLAKMFPTPPSHEHNQITSPAEIVMDMDHPGPHSMLGGIKGEPGTSGQDLMDWSCSTEDASLMLSSSIFAPLIKLYSDEFSPIVLSADMCYKPRSKNQIR